MSLTYQKRDMFDYNRNIFSYLFMLVLNSENILLFNVFTPLKTEKTKNYTKYDILKRHVINNKYFIKKNKEKYIEMFCKTQKLYFFLIRFVNNYYKNKYLVYECETNMNLIPLSEFHSKFTIEICENNTIYKFFIPDLICMWKIALYNQEEMFECPKSLKNPYTNISLKKISLYRIYFASLHNNIKIPKIIQYFYECDFNISQLICEYSIFLREVAIITYVNELPYELYEELSVIKYNFPEITTNLYFYQNISSNYNNIKRKILTDMKSILESYYIYLHSWSEFKQLKYFKKFKQLLQDFNDNKRFYGRKVYRRTENNNLILTYNV